MDVVFVKLLLNKKVSIGMLVKGENIGRADVEEDCGFLDVLVDFAVVRFGFFCRYGEGGCWYRLTFCVVVNEWHEWMR